MLEVTKTGKLWRFRYTFEGKNRNMSLGSYPDVSLNDARDRRFNARKQLTNGIDPQAEKRAAKIAKTVAPTRTLEALTRTWHAKEISRWKSNYAEKKLNRLEKYIFPTLGDRDISSIDPPEFFNTLEKIPNADVASRIRYDISAVYGYAITCGLTRFNPVAGIAKDMRPVINGNFPAIISTEPAGRLLNLIENYPGTFVVKQALRIAPLLFQRPGMMRSMEWSEINFVEKKWVIPYEKMKRTHRRGGKQVKTPPQDHIVPLSQQALEIIESMKSTRNIKSKYVFGGCKSDFKTRSISENTLNAALRVLGIENSEMCVHGFRALMHTISREQLNFDYAHIELQFAHVVMAPNGTAYNRAAFLSQRTEMMQIWADYLDDLKMLYRYT